MIYHEASYLIGTRQPPLLNQACYHSINLITLNQACYHSINLITLNQAKKLNRINLITLNQAKKLKYRGKQIDLLSNHYRCKTNMAVCHKNLGPIWKLICLCEMGVDIPEDCGYS